MRAPILTEADIWRLLDAKADATTDDSAIIVALANSHEELRRRLNAEQADVARLSSALRQITAMKGPYEFVSAHDAYQIAKEALT